MSLHPLRAMRTAGTSVAAALSLTSGGARADVSPIQPYYDFLHWFASARYEKALEQFAPDAIVIGTPECSVEQPCAGHAAIRRRWFSALAKGELPMPWADQRFDGELLRTHGDRPGGFGASAIDGPRRAGHSIVMHNGKIVRVLWRPGADFRKEVRCCPMGTGSGEGCSREAGTAVQPFHPATGVVECPHRHPRSTPCPAPANRAQAPQAARPRA